MPHFTVVPVDDKHRADYDDLEGISRVDYREKGQRSCDPYDTVSSDAQKIKTAEVIKYHQKKALFVGEKKDINFVWVQRRTTAS
ncbi:hypothetical protein AB205_0168540 [Aquarana catesbeiana]|uniref:Uncharacterized protein n=1 Tax=Aquarana catesbeiana TaxID=8400 RepID=A0A2G9QCN5_AQUCT|nr:hypothetical protein AB205_0168540 [Aquarana catesbeiana]